MLVNYIISGSNLITSLLLVGIAIPLSYRKIKPNRLYGIRTKFSYSSDENWYRINQYGGKILFKYGIEAVAKRLGPDSHLKSNQIMAQILLEYDEHRV